jgi:hypothetical protein
VVCSSVQATVTVPGPYFGNDRLRAHQLTSVLFQAADTVTFRAVNRDGWLSVFPAMAIEPVQREAVPFVNPNGPAGGA